MSLRRISLAALFLCVATVTSSQSFTAIPGGAWLLRPPFEPSGAASVTTIVTLDAAGESIGFIFPAPKAGAVRSISFRTGTVTTGDTLDLRLETVSATDGLPTGTLVGVNGNAAHVLGSGDDDIWIKGTNFTANATVVRGTLYAAVIVNGTVPGVFTVQGFADDAGNITRPYIATKVGAGPTWGKIASTTVAPVFAIEYSDGSYEYVEGAWPVETVGTATYNTSTASIDERALEFSLPVTAQVGGAWVWGSMTAAGGADLIFYSGTTPIANGTCGFDVDQVGATGTNIMFCRLPADIILTASATYYLAWKPTTTTNISLQEFDVDTGVGAALMGAFPGGQAFRFASRVDDGSWAAATTTKRPFMGLLLTGVTTTGGGHIIGGD